MPTPTPEMERSVTVAREYLTELSLCPRRIRVWLGEGGAPIYLDSVRQARARLRAMIQMAISMELELTHGIEAHLTREVEDSIAAETLRRMRT